VKFTVTADTTTPKANISVKFIIVDGKVTDENDKYSIAATSPVTLTTAQAIALNAGSGSANFNEAAYKAAKVNGLNLTTEAALAYTDFTLDKTLIATTNGAETTVKFTVTADATTPKANISVKYVIVDGKVTDENDKYSIAATSPVTLTTAEAIALNLGTGSANFNEAAYKAAKVNGLNLTTSAALVYTDFTLDKASILIANGAETTVKFTVTADSTTPQANISVKFIIVDGKVTDENDKYSIAATSPVTLTTAQAIALNANFNEAAYKAAKISGLNLTTEAALAYTDFTLDKTSIATANGAETTVKFTVTADATTPKANISVKFVIVDGKVTDENDKYSIAATSPVTLTTTQATALNANFNEAAYKAAKVNGLNLTTETALAYTDFTLNKTSIATTHGSTTTVKFTVTADSTAPKANISVQFKIVNPLAAYKVQHYHVDSNGNAKLVTTETLKGTVGTAANAKVKTYASHTHSAAISGTKLSGTVLANGSLVLKVYYKVNTYTVTFEDYDGKTIKAQKVAYGSNASAPSNPTRSGYTFNGWNKSSSAWSSVKSDVTVTATYTRNSTGGRTVITRTIIQTAPDPLADDADTDADVDDNDVNGGGSGGTDVTGGGNGGDGGDDTTITDERTPESSGDTGWPLPAILATILGALALLTLLIWLIVGKRRRRDDDEASA
jgi:uncharacterized repeat protein (TIGR02543 family)